MSAPTCPVQPALFPSIWVPRPEHLPAGPLLDAVRARSLVLSRFPYAAQRAYFRAAQRGTVTVDAADQLAVVLLGEHPSTVWGPDWDAAR